MMNHLTPETVEKFKKMFKTCDMCYLKNITHFSDVSFVPRDIESSVMLAVQLRRAAEQALCLNC